MTEVRAKSFDDVNNLLLGFVPAARKYREAVVSLDNMRKLMELLGNPQESYKVIHIAGSSGKTSTAHYVAALLKAGGKKVGLTVSPHIEEVNERVQINLQPLPEPVFCRRFNEFLSIIDAAGFKPTYFELLVAFAYWNFKLDAVDYVVVEVGLGGLLDATNVVTRRDKVCVITDIGLDHTELLGHTLSLVASQKAGIIREQNVVFCYEQSEEVMRVIREVCQQQNAELHEVMPIKSQDFAMELPLFQQRNWYLAYSVFEYLRQRDDIMQLSDTKLGSTTRTYVPARMEEFRIGSKLIILDGAHNPQKMQQLLRSLHHKYPEAAPAALIGLLKSKGSKAKDTLDALVHEAGHIIVTSFETRQDMRKLSIDPLKVVEYLEELNFQQWEVEQDPAQALDRLLSRPEKILLVTGSFYILNHIRPLVLQGAKEM